MSLNSTLPLSSSTHNTSPAAVARAALSSSTRCPAPRACRSARGATWSATSAFVRPATHVSTSPATAAARAGVAAICWIRAPGNLPHDRALFADGEEAGPDAIPLQVEAENRLARQHPEKVCAGADGLAPFDGHREDQHASRDDVPRGFGIVEQEWPVGADLDGLPFLLEPLPAFRRSQQLIRDPNDHRLAEVVVADVGR